REPGDRLGDLSAGRLSPLRASGAIAARDPALSGQAPADRPLREGDPVPDAGGDRGAARPLPAHGMICPRTREEEHRWSFRRSFATRSNTNGSAPKAIASGWASPTSRRTR